MKRLLASASLLVVAAYVIVGLITRETAGVWAADRNPAAKASGTDESPFELPLSGEVDISGVESAHGIMVKRALFLERMKVKAELMTDAQLDQALESTNGEIREMEAEWRVSEARKALEAVTNEYNGTTAARKAQAMLKAELNFGNESI